LKKTGRERKKKCGDQKNPAILKRWVFVWPKEERRGGEGARGKSRKSQIIRVPNNRSFQLNLVEKKGGKKKKGGDV